jgi:hypothetical protein
MSIFGSILGKIFSHANAAPSQGASGAPAGQPSSTPGQSSFNNPSTAAPSPGQSAGTASSTSSTSGSTPVDVEKVLTDLAAKNGQTLDWRKSIVDLMKLLDLDSSLSARKELAKELGYTGSTDDSASMNIWLHKQVMQKLAANGGKVPDDLK